MCIRRTYGRSVRWHAKSMDFPRLAKVGTETHSDEHVWDLLWLQTECIDEIIEWIDKYAKELFYIQPEYRHLLDGWTNWSCSQGQKWYMRFEKFPHKLRTPFDAVEALFRQWTPTEMFEDSIGVCILSWELNLCIMNGKNFTTDHVQKNARSQQNQIMKRDPYFDLFSSIWRTIRFEILGALTEQPTVEMITKECHWAMSRSSTSIRLWISETFTAAIWRCFQ